MPKTHPYTWVSNTLTLLAQAKKPARDKRTSLFCRCVSDGARMFYDSDTRSTMGDAVSKVQATRTLLLVISRMVRLSGVGGGSEI